jgi:hypothetical protein
VRLLVDDRLQAVVDLVALGQQLVEVDLAEHAAEGGLRDLRGRDEVVLHLDDGLGGVHHAEVGDGVDLHRHVVLGDDLLRRHVQGDGPQVHLHRLVDEGDQDEQAGSLDPDQAAEAEHDAPLVLPRDLDGREQEQQPDDQQDDHGIGSGHLGVTPLWARRSTTGPRGGL